MDMHFKNPPGLINGQKLAYYEERFSVLHDSSFPGFRLYVGRYLFGESERAAHLRLCEDGDKVISFELVQILAGDTLEGVSLTIPVEEFVKEMEAKGVPSSIFPEEVILYDHFMRLGVNEGQIETIGWWDRDFWDQASFIEDTFPNGDA
jgi:hypothetical protein